MKIFKAMKRNIFLLLLILTIIYFVFPSMTFCENKTSSEQLLFGMIVRDA